MSPIDRIFLVLVTFVLLASACKKNGNPYSSFEEELDALVEQYVSMGAAIAVINPQGELKTYFYGSKSKSNPLPPDTNSVFDIGSVTKTFTGILLADMYLKGELALGDSLEAYLPTEQVSIPSRGGVKIRLEHLATHSSGLPRAPQDSSFPKPQGYDPMNPYAEYTTGLVYQYLSESCDLLFTPGEKFSYSNTGAGLLGHALGIRDGTSYETALTNRVLNVLGMHQTTLFLSDSQIRDLAPGHNENLDSMPNYTAQDIFQGAGFLKSNLNDMLIYLKANMGLISTPLADAMELSHEPFFDVGDVTFSDRPGRRYDYSLGLGWQICRTQEGLDIISQGGKTSGYISYIGMELNRGTGAIILCNGARSNVIIKFGEEVILALNRY